MLDADDDQDREISASDDDDAAPASATTESDAEVSDDDTEAALWKEMDAEEGEDGARNRTSQDDDADDEPQPGDGDDDDASGAPDDSDDSDDAAGDDADDDLDKILANSPPEVKEAIQTLRDKANTLSTENDTLKHKAKSANGRIGALMKKLNATSQTDDEAAQQRRQERSDRIKEAAKEYPDVAGPMAEAIEDLDGAVTQMRKNTNDAVAEVYTQNFEDLKALRGAEDPMEIVTKNEEAFRTWLQSQSEDISKIVQENSDNIEDPEAVSLVLEAFETHLTPPAGDPAPASKSQTSSKRARQKAGSRATPSRPTRADIDGFGTDEASIWEQLDRAEGEPPARSGHFR